MSCVQLGPFSAQSVIQIDVLLPVAVSIDSFCRFEHFITHDSFLVPPNAKDCIFSKQFYHVVDVDVSPGKSHNFSLPQQSDVEISFFRSAKQSFVSDASIGFSYSM